MLFLETWLSSLISNTRTLNAVGNYSEKQKMLCILNKILKDKECRRKALFTKISNHTQNKLVSRTTTELSQSSCKITF